MTDGEATPQLQALAERLEAWLLESAFPLWWECGADREKGGFHELLTLQGRPVDASPRRMRVQARQSYVYAMAGKLGWNGPWRQAAQHGLDELEARYRREDGLFRTLIAPDGAVLDDTAMLYDQAFALLAMASAGGAALKTGAEALLGRLRRHNMGGFAENAPVPFQSNPHMHLLEAALAWREVDPEGVWDRLADEIVGLCLAHFIDAEHRVLLEFFDSDWRRAAAPAGYAVEPGHQFEWAWLLERWGRLRGDDGACEAARILYRAGSRGVDLARDVAVDQISDDLAITQTRARLWPQTERLKAALILSQTAQGEERACYVSDALGAASALWRYLQTPMSGLWRDKMLSDGTFVEEPAPASSFYHIVCCITSLQRAILSA